MKKIILMSALWVSVGSLYAQNDKDMGSWFIVNGEYEFAKNFLAYMELQARSQKPFHKVFYGEIKGGVTWKFHKNFAGFVGFGNYRTYDWKDLDAGVKTNELRIWEQFVITQSLDRLKFEHRFRAEQAWLNKKYRNRFRYRFNVIIPLNKRKVEKNTVFLSIADEIFMTNTAPYFMRNRFYAGAGYQATDFMTIQAAWVNQFNYTLTSGGAKNFLLLAVNFKFLRKDHRHEKIPTLKD